MRLIDADALREALGITGKADTCKGCKYNEGYYYCNTEKAPRFAYVCECIDDAPTVQAFQTAQDVTIEVPVRHAYLLNAYPYGECSECGYLIDSRDGYNYCPNCGAKMDGEYETD